MKIFYFCFAVLMLFLAITAGAKLLDDIKADSTPVKVRVVECYREVAKYLCDLQRTETVIITVSLERYEWNLFKAVMLSTLSPVLPTAEWSMFSLR